MTFSMPQKGLCLILLRMVYLAVSCLALFPSSANAANCTGTYTYIHTDTNGGNYNLNSGQSLKVERGTLTGSVNNFASNSEICVETGATFSPSNLNNAQGKLINYGTANLQTFAYNTGTIIDNYGTLNFTSGLNMNGATTFYNRAGATMTIASSFQLSNGSTFTNDGLLTAQQDFNTQNGTTLTNNYRLELNGNFNPDGTVNNYGRVYAKKFMNINSNSTVTNYCTLVSYDGFNNNSPRMSNQGTLLITNSSGTPGGPWQNNQKFYNAPGARIAGGDFTNNSTFSGGGTLVFSGKTTNQGPFKGDDASNKINFYDETLTGYGYFDVQNTTPTNTSRTAVLRPLETDSPTTCSASYQQFANNQRQNPGIDAALCPNTSYLLQQNPSKLSTYNLLTGQFSTPISITGVDSGATVNAAGFNPMNGYIYALEDTTNADKDLYRIDQAGHATKLGKLTSLDYNDYNAGDIDANGYYYVSKQYRNIIEIIDVNPSRTATYGKKIGEVLLPAGATVGADLAVNPVDGRIYILRIETGELWSFRIDTVSLTITSYTNHGVTSPAKNSSSLLVVGASYFDRDGNFYAYDNYTGNLWKFRTVPSVSITGQLVGTGDIAINNDGARCALSELPKVDMDFGDAPSSYGSASHNIVAGIYLGDTPPDAETASQPTHDAQGDGDDEDGAPHAAQSDQLIRFPVLKMTDTSYSATFTATNTTGKSSKLTGWIDFDHSGTFDADEAATASVPTGSTQTSITLNWSSIPVDVKLGTTYIRLRLTTDTSITTSTPSRAADDGEVEDFKIAVAMAVPPNSPSLSVVNAVTPAACESRVFEDDFNDIVTQYGWGANNLYGQNIRNWNRAGGGTDTYAQTEDKSSVGQGMAVYFGNGAVRQISPAVPEGFTFDANGKLLTPITAIALRDVPDDTTYNIGPAGESHWGPEPVSLFRSVTTVPGKRYRLYFTAIPEGPHTSPDVIWQAGIMRVDAPGGSVHFKAPGYSEGIQHYAIEFTAVDTTSTIRFINYGHINPAFNDSCNPDDTSTDQWCSIGGGEMDTALGKWHFDNELILDDIVLAEAGCASSIINGTVYQDSNLNNQYDAGSEPGIPSIKVSLYDDKGTASTADDVLVTTTSTSANGFYSFSSLDHLLSYRIEVDTADTDLPANASIGTSNPLTNVTITAGNTKSGQNFGFDVAKAGAPLASLDYRLDECTWDGTANEILDSSGNNLHATASNGANTAAGGTVNRAGVLQAASSQYVNAGDILNDVFGRSSSHFTITAWVKPESLSADQTNHATQNTIFAKASDSYNDNLEIGINDNGTVHVYLDAAWSGSGGVDGYADFGNTGDITTGTWHFVAVTYDGSSMKVYIDGKAYENTSKWNGAGTIDQATGSPFTIGSSQHIDNYFDGAIDEVKVFSNTLDAAQISTIRTNESKGLNYDGSLRADTRCTTTGGISGMVYLDTNNNGSFDASSESGIGSITVTLKKDADGSVIATTTSAADGSYTFADVSAALVYRIEVDTTDSDLPTGAGINSTNPLAGISVVAEEITANQNFGFKVQLAGACPAGYAVQAKTGYAAEVVLDQGVSYDIRALGAPADAGTTATYGNSALISYDDVLILDMGTIVAGNTDLEFSLTRSNYSSRILIETSLDNSTYTRLGTYGWYGNLSTPGTQDALERLSIAAPAAGVRYIRFTYESSSTWLDAVGYAYTCEISKLPGTITGKVYIDSNANNAYDTAESGLGSISVSLLNDTDGSNIASTSTAVDGSYSFNNVDADLTYRIAVDTADTDLPVGFTIGTTNPLPGVTVTEGGTTADQNFGFDIPVTSISGKAWFDIDADGIQNDGADAYIEGATVELYDTATSTVVSNTTTNAKGEYQFTNSVGLKASTSYQLRIAKLDNKSPVSSWVATSLHAGSNTALDSDASLSGSYWVIDLTTPTTGIQTVGYGFGFTNNLAIGCLDNGATGVSNDSITNAHPNTYDFEFDGKQVAGFCSERTEGDPQAGDNYLVNASDRQGLSALQREKIARSYSALTDPDIVFQIASAFGSGKNQKRLDDLLHYMTWYYTYYNEDLAAMSAAHLDTNSNYTASQRIVMKALAGKVADRVNGANGETQYPLQNVFWLWNMTSSNRQDIVVPALYAQGLSCSAGNDLSGKVFEDMNYGGGAGQAFGTSGTVGISGAIVELYNAFGGYVSKTTTGTDGTYKFSGLAKGNYYVRVVSDSVNSTRTGSNGSELGIQTYRSDGSTPVTNEIGGRKPAGTDTAANTSNQTLDTSTFMLSNGGQAQSVQTVSVSASAVSGVDFGFNFSTIVNTNDSGQGSLRQFILNSNLLSKAGLDQALPATLDAEYAAGTEVSIFMIPSSQLADGVATLGIQTELPASSKGNVAFDARTQTLNIGDTNTGTVGESTTVGIDKLAVEPISRPEVALDCSALPDHAGAEYCMTISGTKTPVHGFAFYGAATGNLDDPSAALYIKSSATSTVSGNLFGSMPDGSEPVWEKQNWRIGLLVEGATSVTANYFAYNGYGAIFNTASTAGSTFTANQMDENGPNVDAGALNGSEDGDSLAIWGRAEVTVEGNYIKNSRGLNDNGNGNGGGNGNIDHGNLIEVTNAGKALIRNNTLSNGFVADIGVYDGSSNVRIEYNILTAARGTGRSPTGSGVLVNPLGKDPDPVYISRNSIFANNGLGIDLDPGNQSQTGNRVTKNDAHDSDSGPNDLLNFPFITEAYLMNGNLVLAGCSPAKADIELFEADVSPGGTDAPGINKFGNAKDYGEGQRYLITLQEGAANDTDTTECAHLSDADGNNNRGMAAFRFTIPIPDGIVEGDMLTATATLSGVGTSEFCLVSDGVFHVTYDISGTVFEDVNYGSGAGRPFGTAGTVGINDALVELYDATTGEKVDSTHTANNGVHDGAYSFPGTEVGTYYLRVVSEGLSSTRTGSDGSELAVQTFRSDGAIDVINEVGGAHPDKTDGPAQQGSSLLDTDTFKFSRGPLNGDYAQNLQYIDLHSADIDGADFGFNFDTVVNTETTGQGSLHQAILNANLLGGEATLTQQNRVAGKENILFALRTGDANHITQDGISYWAIKGVTLPDITAPLVIDGATQTGFSGKPIIELNGASSGNGTDGLRLTGGSDGSVIRNLGVNSFSGAGIHILDSGSHHIERNYIGVNLTNNGAHGNTAAGVLLSNASNNMIGSPVTGDANIIANNNGAGISVLTGSAKNALLGNAIYNNGGLGIDLGGNGVTPNDVKDVDTGPNDLLNFPDTKVNSFSVNGSKILAYDFDLDVPLGSYRLEFFKNTQKDTSGFGEGRLYLGYKDISHPGTGLLNFKGTVNASQTLANADLITATLTEKTGAATFGATSEFSGTQAGTRSTVCTSLISNPDDSPINMVIDENTTDISLLEAKDSNGKPITYVISGGVDGGYFTVVGPTTNATLDCATIKFISSTTVITKAASLNTEKQIIVPPGYLPPPGDFETPLDNGFDNVYDLQITALTLSGKRYVRDMSVRVINVNEPPEITSPAEAALKEDGILQALDIDSRDPDGTLEGRGLSYSITGGVDARYFTVSSTSGILKFRAIPDYDAPTDSNGDNVYEVEVTVTDDGGLTASKLFKITVVNDESDDGVMLQVRALLQGAYDTSTGLMADNLHQLGMLPTAQPYAVAPFNHTGTEILNPLLLELQGQDAAVDWMLLELRKDLKTVTARRAVILQRDGDLVDAQSGAPALHFAGVPAGDYYVSLRHRNHLDIISAAAISLDHNAKLIDFSKPATATKGQSSRLVVDSKALMWAGDINVSQTLTASGPNNDLTTLLGKVITAKSNRDTNTNFIMSGYLSSDLNLDGKTLFTEPNNDASLLAGNIILHPLNTDFVSNYIVQGGLAP